jgi:hypothetical protein
MIVPPQVGERNETCAGCHQGFVRLDWTYFIKLRNDYREWISCCQSLIRFEWTRWTAEDDWTVKSFLRQVVHVFEKNI